MSSRATAAANGDLDRQPSGTTTRTLYANGSGQLNNSAAGYAVAVNGMATIHVNGHAGDMAKFYDSPGNDTFYAYADYNNSGQLAGMYGSAAIPTRPAASARTSDIRPTAAAIRPYSSTRRATTRSMPTRITTQRQAIGGHAGSYGGGYSNSAKGFATNVANSTTAAAIRPNSSTRRATTHSMPTPITTTAASLGGMSGMLRRADIPTRPAASAHNFGYSTNGGSDTALFFDSPGNDTFYAYADYNNSGQPLAGMYGSYGGGYSNSASGFGTNVGYSTNGGSDTAAFFDAPGTNTFYAYADYNNSGQPLAGMYGSSAIPTRPRASAPTSAYSTNSGNDTANLTGSSRRTMPSTRTWRSPNFTGTGLFGGGGGVPGRQRDRRPGRGEHQEPRLRELPVELSR